MEFACFPCVCMGTLVSPSSKDLSALSASSRVWCKYNPLRLQDGPGHHAALLPLNPASQDSGEEIFAALFILGDEWKVSGKQQKVDYCTTLNPFGLKTSGIVLTKVRDNPTLKYLGLFCSPVLCKLNHIVASSLKMCAITIFAIF